jgi:hypothetical protein
MSPQAAMVNCEFLIKNQGFEIKNSNLREQIMLGV